MSERQMRRKERPILFSAPMVRSLLNGTKTQTRRIVKWPSWAQPHPEVFARDLRDGQEVWYVRGGDQPSKVLRCPHGQPGDRLWVRETHLVVGGIDSPHPRVVYRATNDGPDAWLSPSWRPSIYMPRWASRITLEITGVRVERLQDISDSDVFAEGIQDWVNAGMPSDGTARGAFRVLWQGINGCDSWHDNPWVWVIEFMRVEGER